MMNKYLPLVLLLTFLLPGCMATSVPDLAETMVSPGFPTVKEPRQAKASVGQTAEPYRGGDSLQRHSLSFVDLDIRQALAALSRLSNTPIVAEPGVGGTVNLIVEDKTVAEILMAMTKQFGYSVYIEDGVIVVGEPRLVTKAFYLNYLRDKRSFSSVTNASISSTSATDSSSSARTEQGNVTVTTSGNSDFWKELKDGLQKIVFGASASGEQMVASNSSGKKIVINDMAGVVYVTDTEENIEVVSSFLADVGEELKRQVLIQAHIVEVDLDNEFSLGIDWAGVLNAGSASTTISQGLLPTTQSGVFAVNIDASDFSLMLDAFKEQGHVNMLSSPKISTMNNQKAVIKLTTKEVTWVNETTFNSSGDVLTTSTTPQIDEVGLFLDVTPNINADGVVTMHVHPSISEIKAISESPDGTSSKPIIDIREVDTMAEVKSGETVVIAGLIVDRTRETKRSVPLLGDLPFVGLAFSNFKQELKKTELVIFLTPYVLESQSMSKIRKQHEERLRRLEALSSFIESRAKKTASELPTESRSDMIDKDEQKAAEMVKPVVVEKKAAGMVKPLVVEKKAAGMVKPLVVEQKAAGMVKPLVVEQKAAGMVKPAVVEEKAAEMVKPAVDKVPPAEIEPAGTDQATPPAVSREAEGWATSLPRRMAGGEQPVSWDIPYK